MIAIMKDRPNVSGTNRKWYIAVNANWRRDSSTTVMSGMASMAWGDSAHFAPVHRALHGAVGNRTHKQREQASSHRIVTMSAPAASPSANTWVFLDRTASPSHATRRDAVT